MGWLLRIVSILALAGCGTTESTPPAGGTAPADTAGGPKPATEATRPASDAVLKSPPSSDKADVKEADGGLAAAPETPTIEEASASILPRATATERLTDQ